jgi:hypothetical protein
MSLSDALRARGVPEVTIQSTPEDRAAHLGPSWDSVVARYRRGEISLGEAHDAIYGGSSATDHKAEAEAAARAGKYDIAQYHATMRLCDLLEEDEA